MPDIYDPALEGNWFSTNKSRTGVIEAANKVAECFLKALRLCENQVPAIESYCRRVTTVKDTEDAQKALRDEINKTGDAFSKQYRDILDGEESPYKIGQTVYDAAARNKADLKRPEVAGPYNDAIMRFRNGDVCQAKKEVLAKFMSLNDQIRNAEDKLSGTAAERTRTMDLVRALYLFVQRRVNALESAIDVLARG